ncbi:hypothetical protein [Nocardia sp. NPDC058705]|uniref:hypothetical protein n=1 Tax=Nocardia sp. NPDC058705 TaxID=3346609 RepID=UPI003676B98B
MADSPMGNMMYATFSDIAESIRRLPEEKNISAACFNELRELYIDNGWRRIYEYDGPDAGIDYVRVHLKKGGSVLRFRWDHYDQGSVAGPRRYIEEIARYVRENCGQ